MIYISIAGDIGIDLALQQFLKWRCGCYIGFSEYPFVVLKKRISDGILQDAPIWDDFFTFDGKLWHKLVDIIVGKRADSRAQSKSSCSYEDTFLRLVSEIQPTYILWQTNESEQFAIDFANRLEVFGYAATIIESKENLVGAPTARKSLWILGRAKDAECLQVESAVEVTRRLRNSCESKKYTSTPRVCRINERVAHRLDRLKALEHGTIPGMVAVMASIFQESIVF